MTDLSTFEGRMAFGEEAEDKFEEIVKSKGLTCLSTKNVKGWTPYYDKVNGDFIVLKDGKNYKVDVKRTSITLDSIGCFKGDYFAVCDYKMNTFHMISTKEAMELKALLLSTEVHRIVKAASGAEKLPYSELMSIQNKIKLEDWIND